MTDDATGDPPLPPPPPRERWREVFAAADRALALSDAERNAFIEQCAREDPALGAELVALLAGGEASSALDGPALEFAFPVLGSLATEMDRVETSRVGPYRIVGLIGRGGMGAVYLAERADDQYRKRVALKLLPIWSAGDDHRVRRFLEERQILAALEHPDIARLLDGGVTPDGLPWFAMEYVEGTPLDRYCVERDLSIEQRLALFCRVCAAVEYAHQNLVVHRDLKPANILVKSDGAVKLLDFGIAKLLAEDATGLATNLTQTDERFMTPLFASPEQVGGESVSTASDVYALGVLLYGLLAGRHPYRLSTLQPHEVARAILEQEPERPSDAVFEAATPNSERIARRIRGDLDAIVLKAMEKQQRRRYGSVEQLEADVRRYLAGVPVVARPATRVDRAIKFLRRHRIGAAVATAVALLVTGFTVVTLVQAKRIAFERDRAQQAATSYSRLLRQRVPANVGTSNDDARAPVAQVGALTSTFDSQILFMSDRLAPDSTGNLGHQEIYLMNPDGSNQRRLTHTDGLIQGGVLSPDGRQIAMSSRRGEESEIFIMDIDGNHPVQVTHLSEMKLGAVAPTWSPDGKRLAFNSFVQHDVFVCNRDGTGLRNLTRHPGKDLMAAWSPRGDKIAFVSTRDGEMEIYVMNADGRHQVRLTHHASGKGDLPWVLRPTWSPDGSKIAFASSRDGNREIYVMTADGSGITRMTNDPADDAHAAWSPDGTQIAFMSNRLRGHMQVFVMKAEGSEPRPITEPSPTSFSGFPSWSLTPRRVR